ncbi:nucleoporin complex subunit 54-domain-containing protein [Mucidula mucida]|nr:nucleoporin complex subunit 54-domain-containing protein [Mucidula mucida]
MSIFGNTTGGGSSIFGASNTNQQPTQAASTPSLFGSTNTNTAAFGQNNANTNTGGSIFGQPANQNKPSTFGATTGGSLFGQPSATTGNTQQPQNNSSFFATPPAGQQNQQQKSNNLFAGSTNPLLPSTATSTNPLFGGASSTPSLFGSTNSTAPATGTSSLFGSTSNTNTNNAPATSNTGSLFGSSTGGSLFGSTANTNNNPLNQSTLTTSIFGKPPQQQLGANSLLKSTVPGSSQPQPADSQAQFERLSQAIEGITNAWNPNSPHCRFQHYFYNLVDPSQVHMYGRPPNATNDVLWQKALQENPDPSCLVPVIANGFDDLRQRVEAQTQQSAAHTASIKELQNKLSSLSSKHTADIVPRLARFSQTQVQIAQRIMALVQHLHLLIPAVRSSAIRPEEEQLAGELEAVDEEVRGNRGKMKAKLDELWAVFGAMKAREEGLRERRTSGDWKVVDEDGLSRIAQILAEQQAGLAHLTKVLHKDLKDLGVIMGTGPPITAGDDTMTPDNLWTSTSSLRASVFR